MVIFKKCDVMEQKGHQICDQHNKVAIKHIIDITYFSKTKNLLDSVIIAVSDIFRYSLIVFPVYFQQA